MGIITHLGKKRNALGCIIFAAAASFSLTSFAAKKDVLQAVVSIESKIPPNARTAKILGTERRGSGVVIDNQAGLDANS